MSWRRVRKDNPCPICNRPDWCLVAADGSAAVCQRVESSRRIGDAGYFHCIDGSISAKTPTYSCIIRQQNEAVPADMHRLAVKYHNAMTTDLYVRISDTLDVTAGSLKLLRVGYDGRAFTFPMRDADRCIIGIRRRFDTGLKVCVPGSRNGLFIPAGLTGTGTLLILEGNSDTAAALDMEYEAIGRPNCNSLINETIRFIRKHTYDRVVIIPDNDVNPDGTNPGAAGGYLLAERLRLHCKDVRVVLPPAEYNDLRCWAHLSLTRTELDRLIEAAEPIQLEVCA